MKIEGSVHLAKEIIPNQEVTLITIDSALLTDKNGYFKFENLYPGNYDLCITALGFDTLKKKIHLVEKDVYLNIDLFPLKNIVLDDVIVIGQEKNIASGKLKDVEGSAIYAGKKTQVILLNQLNANLANNNTRQIYARVPGLNIWENDRGGLQLGIGGRGLNPSRSSNFNIRQNGYDISADALGYPESYYSPSAEALSQINIVRGAASLQYGSQFGGLIDFVLKEGSKNKKVEVLSRNSIGSYGFLNSFTSLGGTISKTKLNYYAFYQYKKSNDYRPNSHFEQHHTYIHLAYQASQKLKITGQYTFMTYLAQQPGGLTEEQFYQDISISNRARNWFKVNWHLTSLIFDYDFNANSKLNWRTFTLQGQRLALGILNYINRPDIGGNRDLLADKYNNITSEIRYIKKYNLNSANNHTFLIGTRIYSGLTLRKQGEANDEMGPEFTFTGAEPNRSVYRFPGFNLALFVENIFYFSSKWSVTPGIRFEQITTKSKGYYFKQNVFIPNDKIFEQASNPRSFAILGLGSSYKLKHNMEVYANFSQNYRSINFNDLRIINANARVDPNLKDERGFNFDLGYRGTFRQWLYADVSIFYLKYNDRIGSIFTKDTSFMTYRLRSNISDSRNFGVELLLDGDLLKAFFPTNNKYKLNIYTSLSLINARYVHSKNTAVENKLVENVPPILFRTGASYGNKKYNITLQYTFQEKQYSDATNTTYTPNAVDGIIPSFSVLDLSISYHWKYVSIFSGMNNITNKKYFSRRSDGYPGPGILPAEKRNFYLTFQVKI